MLCLPYEPHSRIPSDCSVCRGRHGRGEWSRSAFAAVQGRAMNNGSKPCRLLIVEDDDRTRSALERLLRLNGHEVAAASTVRQGTELLGWRPDCLVLDLALGDGAGEELLRTIRREVLPIRVAVVTGSADRERLEHLKQFEPDLFLMKPIQVSTLLDWVDASCRR